MRQITDTMRQAWARDPVTQEFLANLQASKQETMELWAREAYIAEKPENTLQANAKALGGVALLDKLITQIEDLMLSDEHNLEGEAEVQA